VNWVSELTLREEFEKGYTSFESRCVFLPCKIPDMNTQDIITPLAQFVEWTFQTVLVPMSNGFNWAVIGLGLGGLFFWLRLQKKYNNRAEQEGSIM